MNRSIANYNEMPSESPFLLEGKSTEAMRIEGHAGPSTANIDDPFHSLPMQQQRQRQRQHQHQHQQPRGIGNNSVMNCGSNDPSKMPQEMYNNHYSNDHNSIHPDESHRRSSNRSSIPLSQHHAESYFRPIHHHPHGHQEHTVHGGRAVPDHLHHPIGMQQQQQQQQQQHDPHDPLDPHDPHGSQDPLDSHDPLPFQPNRSMHPVPSRASRSPSGIVLEQQRRLDVAPPPPSFIYVSSRSNRPTTSIVERIRQEVRSMTSGTRMRHATTNSNEDRTIQLLNRAQETLHTHWVLGTGSFSLVTAVTLDSSDQPNDSNRQRQYACKAIKHEIAAMGGGNFVLAASQLAYEAHLLSCLDHPNIIKVRGLDEQGVLAFERIDHGFVMLMDVLCETLEQRIDRWRMKTGTEDHSNKVAILLRRNLDKLAMCLQLASALEYIHSKHIVYRDLKPANIGFSSVPSTNNPEGEEIYTHLQLFDFGLCHEFTPSSASTTCNGIIGTMRYMAPEVCLDTNYDYNCDIYSYAVVCWELWTQLVPFESMTTPDLYREFVCRRGYRPYPDQSRHEHPEPEFSLQDPHPAAFSKKNLVPKEILVLLSQAWTHDPNSRIPWSRMREQLTLFETLVDLQLEAQDLSDSTTHAGFDEDDQNNDNNDHYFGYDYGRQIFDYNDDRPTW